MTCCEVHGYREPPHVSGVRIAPAEVTKSAMPPQSTLPMSLRLILAGLSYPRRQDTPMVLIAKNGRLIQKIHLYKRYQTSGSMMKQKQHVNSRLEGGVSLTYPSNRLILRKHTPKQRPSNRPQRPRDIQERHPPRTLPQREQVRQNHRRKGLRATRANPLDRPPNK